MKIAFHTLGCKLNFAETSTLKRVAEDAGYAVVPFDSVAEIYVINTCTVTEKTDKKCRNSIRKAIRSNPEGKVIVTGCFAELKPDDIHAIEGVSLVIGNNEKVKFLQYLSTLNDNNNVTIAEVPENAFFNAYSVGDRTRSFLKVQDGCNYFCSYCTIPFARGRSRNASVSELLNEAKLLASKNIKEIVLTGINIGDFGHTTRETFFQLIRELEKVEGIERYRMSSIEPDLLTSEIIDFVSISKKIMPHFHIPLQSGSNVVLKMMNRKYRTEDFRNKVNKIFQTIPDASVGTDVIVGFPGETEDEFIISKEFLNTLDLSYLHVFSYSERKNTASEKLPNKVREEIKNDRSNQLHLLSNIKKERYYTKYIGKNKIVLFESRTKDNMMYGFTDNYLKVEASLQRKFFNAMVPVELITFDSEKQCIIGKIIG